MLTPSAMLTDLYQVTMAYGYWKLGRANEQAIFNLSYRTHPFDGNFTIAAGLAEVIDFLKNFRFSQSDIDFFKKQKSPTNNRLFDDNFCDYLLALTFSCDIDAIPEGTPVQPQQPLLRVKGPLLQCQLLETALLNLIQFPSLIATKAARISMAAKECSVIEFGLRRAQGPNGGLTASRAAYIGGCNGTSNVLAGQLYDIPIYGTQAHSWIMSFDNEQHAFDAFAEVMPENTVLLVDTFNTIHGVKHAINTAAHLKKKGYQLNGIRLDSGDLIALSFEARQLLDQHGLTSTQIMASGDLDEYRINEIKNANAPIDIFGVGTRLATSEGQNALDVIYKLGAIQQDQKWQYKLKTTDQKSKATNPGALQTRRYYKNNLPIQDTIYDIFSGISAQPELSFDHYEDLLTPIFREGTCVYQDNDIHQTRQYCKQLLQAFVMSQPTIYFDPRLTAIKNQIYQSL